VFVVVAVIVVVVIVVVVIVVMVLDVYGMAMVTVLVKRRLQKIVVFMVVGVTGVCGMEGPIPILVLIVLRYGHRLRDFSGNEELLFLEVLCLVQLWGYRSWLSVLGRRWDPMEQSETEGQHRETSQMGKRGSELPEDASQQPFATPVTIRNEYNLPYGAEITKLSQSLPQDSSNVLEVIRVHVYPQRLFDMLESTLVEPFEW
jgi:hypothetical protein